MSVLKTLKQLSFKFKSNVISGVVVTLLIACSPNFDWRSSKRSSHGDTYVITFPGKAVSVEKTVIMAGEPHRLMLSAVQVDSAQFALGSVPAKSEAQAKAIAQALAESFTSNLKITPALSNRSNVVLARSKGAFDVAYPAADRYAQARFIWTEHAAYELLVVGKAQDITPEIADTFIRSMQFE